MPYIIYLLDCFLWLFNKVAVDENKTRKEDDMKTFTSVISTFVLCVGLTLTGYAENGPVSGGTFAEEAMVQSVESHKIAIQQHQDRATMLEQKIQTLENRLDMFKNSYRDPKGFRQASWKRMVGTLRGELKNIRQRIVWHEEQIALLKT